jgi:transcriptional regulator GlxA family with amidase domain
MLYFDPALVARQIINEVISGDITIRPVARDPHLAADFMRLFNELRSQKLDSMAAEESLLCCLMRVLQRHGVDGPRRVHGSPPVMRAIQCLEAAPETTTSLADLAALSGVSRFQLLRGFFSEVGATPHAYLIQLRVRMARRLLAVGEPPANAAQLSGFADQSHLTRAFVRQFGITPGRYKAAVS